MSTSMNDGIPVDPESAGTAGTVGESSIPAVTVRGLVVEQPSGKGPYAASIRAVRGVSCTVPRGQVTAVVGANGAGKTTTFRAISGAIPFVAGSIDVLGTGLGPATVALPDGAAIVPDAPAYPQRWTARHVARAHAATCLDFDIAAFESSLRETRVPLGRRVSGLSRGELTQLSIAAALAQDPRLLILDEPLARLDPLARTELVDRLRALLASGDRTILLSTHDLDGMDRFVDHLVVIARGQTVLEGDVETLREEFVVLEQETAEYAASVPVTASPLIGPVSTGVITRSLVHVEDAAGLPTGAFLRPSGLNDLVTHWLRAARTQGRPCPRQEES